MPTSELFGAKSIGFFVIYGVLARTRGRGWACVDIFRTRGGVKFLRASFMDGP